MGETLQQKRQREAEELAAKKLAAQNQEKTKDGNGENPPPPKPKEKAEKGQFVFENISADSLPDLRSLSLGEEFLGEFHGFYTADLKKGRVQFLLFFDTIEEVWNAINIHYNLQKVDWDNVPHGALVRLVVTSEKPSKSGTVKIYQVGVDKTTYKPVHDAGYDYGEYFEGLQKAMKEKKEK